MGTQSFKIGIAFWWRSWINGLSSGGVADKMSNEPETEKSQSEEIELPEVKRRRRARSKWLPRQVFAAAAGFLSLLGLAYLLALWVKRKIHESKVSIVVTTSATSTILGVKRPGENPSAQPNGKVGVTDAESPLTCLANVAK